jgi:hypothetical protein
MSAKRIVTSSKWSAMIWFGELLSRSAIDRGMRFNKSVSDRAYSRPSAASAPDRGPSRARACRHIDVAVTRTQSATIEIGFHVRGGPGPCLCRPAAGRSRCSLTKTRLCRRYCRRPGKDTSTGRELSHMSRPYATQPVGQIPPHAKQDHRTIKMTAFEHHETCSMLEAFSCHRPLTGKFATEPLGPVTARRTDYHR